MLEEMPVSVSIILIPMEQLKYMTSSLVQSYHWLLEGNNNIGKKLKFLVVGI